MIYNGETGLTDLAAVVKQTTDDLRPVRKQFDTIVVQGMSGVVVGAPVAVRLRKPLVIVRKVADMEEIYRHTYNSGIINPDALIDKRALFLDDFVSGGGTRKRVLQAVTSQGGHLVGQYTYQNGSLHWYGPGDYADFA